MKTKISDERTVMIGKDYTITSDIDGNLIYYIRGKKVTEKEMNDGLKKSTIYRLDLIKEDLK